MKRIGFLAAAVLALALLSPGGEGDVGELLPVELLYVYIEEEDIHLETEGGQWGAGPDLNAALRDLEATSPGKVFLETADHLLVTREAAALLPELMELLRPATKVYIAQAIDTNAAAYLRARKPGVSLGDIRAGERKIPTLIFREGRYHIEA